MILELENLLFPFSQMTHCLLLFKLHQVFQDFLAIKGIQYCLVLQDLNRLTPADKFPFSKVALFVIFLYGLILRIQNKSHSRGFDKTHRFDFSFHSLSLN